MNHGIYLLQFIEVHIMNTGFVHHWVDKRGCMLRKCFVNVDNKIIKLSIGSDT